MRHSPSEDDLLNALEQREFYLVYQPIFNPDSCIVGAEALLRWRSPQYGLLFPGDFIKRARPSQSILQISAWVMETVCHQLGQWASDPVKRSWTMSVNIRSHQLYTEKAVACILETLQRYGADPRKLYLELSETEFLPGFNGFSPTHLHALHKQGIKLALDNFGMGYSFLNHLKKLPVSQIKIDQYFFKNLLSDNNEQKIVDIMSMLAGLLKLEMAAKGVETPEQFDYLKKAGFSFFQGYFFGHPALLKWHALDAMESAHISSSHIR